MTEMWRSRRRWFIVAALFFITVINYVDRQSLSLLAPTLQRALSMDDRTYGHIVSAFLIAYTISYIFAGRLCDWLGSRMGMTLFVVWWSIAEMLPPLARSGTSLGAGRFLLGLGEAGNYVAGPKIVREWFPVEERALALGIYTAGATLGATIAPPLIAGVTAHFGWPMVFFATGLFGIAWVIPWLWLSRRPAVKGKAAEPVIATEIEAEGGNVWRDVLTSKATWLLLVARFLTDPVWFFFLFWFPKYLQQVRGLSLGQTGAISWTVYLAADVGALAGGWICGPMIRKGMEPLAARKRVMTYAACLVPLSPLAALLPTLQGSLAIAAIIAMAHMAWLILLTSVVLDYFPASRVGTAAGVIAGGTGLGGILSSEAIGAFIPHHGYTPVFWVMGILHPLALMLIWRVKPPVKRSAVALA